MAPPFRLRTVRGRLVQPHLNFDRASELLAQEEEDWYRKKPGDANA
jgi:hypothetical protein